jgi:hypothetical protein
MPYSGLSEEVVRANGTTFFTSNAVSNNTDHILPEQHEGSQTNTEATETLADAAAARAFFEVVRNRLLNVNAWHEYAGTGTASFQLTDERGSEVQRTAQKGDHFQIDIPGPGSQTGEGYDWVRIEEISEEHSGAGDSVAIRVRPAPNPRNEKGDVAHFFTSEATSNFVVKRQGNTVTAAVYGRNEKPNTEAETLIDKARNTAVATGAISGFSKIQWKNLITGLLQR